MVQFFWKATVAGVRGVEEEAEGSLNGRPTGDTEALTICSSARRSPRAALAGRG